VSCLTSVYEFKSNPRTILLLWTLFMSLSC
jgi:hypothetical protein